MNNIIDTLNVASSSESTNSWNRLIHDYIPTINNKRHRVAVFDFTKPWDILSGIYTKDEYLSHKDDGYLWRKDIISLRPSYRSGAITLTLSHNGYTKDSDETGYAYPEWMDSFSRFQLHLRPNTGITFTADDNRNNYYIEAIIFEDKDAKISHVDLVSVDSGSTYLRNSGEAQSNYALWITRSVQKALLAVRTDGLAGGDALARVKVIYTSPDDWGGFNSFSKIGNYKPDQLLIDEIDKSGDSISFFNFSRPWTLDSKYTKQYFINNDNSIPLCLVTNNPNDAYGRSTTKFKSGPVTIEIIPISKGEDIDGAYLRYSPYNDKYSYGYIYWGEFDNGTGFKITIEDNYTITGLHFADGTIGSILFCPYINDNYTRNFTDTSLPLYSTDEDWNMHWTAGGKVVKTFTLYHRQDGADYHPWLVSLAITYKSLKPTNTTPTDIITYKQCITSGNNKTFYFKNKYTTAFKDFIKVHKTNGSYIANSDTNLTITPNTADNAIIINYNAWDKVDYVEFQKGALHSSDSNIKDNEYTKITFSNGNPTTPDDNNDNTDDSYTSDTDNEETTSGVISFTDTGDIGYSVDSNEILYAGGQEVIPKTFAQKDNTLFMGNYKEKNALITDKSLFSSIRTDTHLGFKYKDSISKGSLGSLYMYDNQLKHNSYDITTFKGGEVYRFGLVFQDSRGQWSGVVPLYDYRNTLYPNDKEDKVNLVKAVATIPSSLSKRLYNLGYRRVQGVVVYPSEANRRVVCQGVLCPTVYNINDRKNNSPYAVSSWFFREMRAESSDGTYSVKGTQNLHNCNIYNDIYDGIKDKLKVKSKLVTDTAERYLRIGGSTNGSSGTFEGGGGYFGNGRGTSGFSGSRRASSEMVINTSSPITFDLTAPSTDFKAELSTASIYHKYAYESYNNVDYFVDWNTLTMNTPEVNFSTANTSHNILTENLKLRIIGVIPLTSSSNDVYVNTNSEYIKQDAGVGLKKKITTYSNNSPDGGDIRTVAFDWQDYDFHLGDKDNVVLDSTDKQCIMPDFSFNNIDLTLYSALGIQEAMFGGIKAYPIYPWQGAKSLLGQPKEVTDNKDYKDYEGKMFDGLNKKIISNIRTSSITYYFRPTEALSYNIGNAGIYDGDIPLVKLNRDNNDSDFTGSFNYYGELDSVINPTSYYYTYFGSIYFYGLADYKRYAEAHRSDSSPTSIGKNVGLHNILQNSITNDPVRIRYKSSPHIAFHLNYTSDGKQEILPYFKYKGYSFGKFDNLDVYKDSSTKYAIPGWSEKTRKLNSSSGVYGSTDPLINQECINLQNYNLMDGQNVYFIPLYGYLYIGELYQDLPKDLSEIFGGTSPMAYEQNQWHKAGPVAELNANGNTSIEFLQGDTYYQRYDCLKTYPYSSEDPNQIVEILSFMCETRMNIDGRYDINRGNSSNLNATPQNFNLFNPVYTQEDNFINHYYLDPEKNKDDTFSNTLLWTKTKTLGEEIDSWANINQVSSFNMDGDKGAISAVRNYNDNLVTFQDNGIARVLYNERVQVNTSDGVPIEFSNSGKVSGKQYISDTIGCSNRDTIQITPEGIYFMDSNSKDIMLFNNGIKSVSKVKGFNSYLYNRDFSKYKAFYDEKLKDVYFTDDVTSLDFNEQLGEFEGFYSYGGTDYMFNYLDSFVAIKDNKIWKQFAGDYNYFFGDNANNCKPFSVTLISNQGLNDKTFTGIEFEADTWDSNKNLLNETFDHLDIWNEYQMGTEKLNKININNHYHFSDLKEKFRIWRAQLPREVKLGNLLELPYVNKNISYDNYHIVEKTVNIDKIFDVHRSMNRIRNPWAYIKLIKSSTDNHKTTLHNIKIDYFE